MADWVTSKVKCEQVSGYLITVSSGQEDLMLRDAGSGYHDNIWIGMTELVRL